MVIYLDLVFFLNSLADAFALYVTSRLSGISLRTNRVILASVLGGIYGVICSVPLFCFMRDFVPQILVAAFLVWVVFGLRAIYVRLCLLFFVLSCAMGGVLIAFAQSCTRYGVSNSLSNLNWKVFFLVGGLCYFFLSIVFRGSARHIVSGEISKGFLWHNGHKIPLNVLFDTGHTLRDPYTGNPVMTIWVDATRELWSDEEWSILEKLGDVEVTGCLEKLTKISSGRFWIIPYRAVGTRNGALLCFSAEQVVIGKKSLGKITVALSGTSLSDGGSCNALWNGEI